MVTKNQEPDLFVFIFINVVIPKTFQIETTKKNQTQKIWFVVFWF
jgi:hypothetical protein